ncbi:MAG: FtsX-like permease family protein [Bacteroidales bacterium]|nr:ABC transporter permease [Lentimicrobiaceae bacterium]MDD5694138.1 FtsX-like permease family protein [Bacteroidales bacterium]
MNDERYVMKEEFKIAWRNLWRNRRRTLITSASIFFAVFFAVIMRSYQLGSYDHMINNFIESFTGYLQVQHIKYQDNPFIDNSFDYHDSIASAISRIDNVVSVTPHLESFTLASSGTQTKGVSVIAIDPEKEKNFSDPESKLVRFRITDETVKCLKESASATDDMLEKVKKNMGRAYSSSTRLELEMGLTREDNEDYLAEILRCASVSNGYLTKDDHGILVSDRLAGYLKVGVGDSVILMGQGYHGGSANGIFPVRGIIKIPSPEIDNKLIIMTIPTAQAFFDAENKITSLVVNLTDKSNRTIKTAKSRINALIQDKNTVARSWYELNPILYQQIQGDSQTGMAMLGILYFIIFFGIFGTVLMMVSERKREFGVLVAIGMQKKRLKKIVTIEMMMLGAIGVVCGLSASAPLIMYFFYKPILLRGDLGNMMEDWGWDAVMPTAWFGPYFYWQAVVVAFMVALATIYPMRRISRLKEIEALKS